jgi:hypothetical protein
LRGICHSRSRGTAATAAAACDSHQLTRRLPHGGRRRSYGPTAACRRGGCRVAAVAVLALRPNDRTSRRIRCDSRRDICDGRQLSHHIGLPWPQMIDFCWKTSSQSRQGKVSTTLVQDGTAHLCTAKRGAFLLSHRRRLAERGARQFGDPAIRPSGHPVIPSPSLKVLPVGSADPGQREGSRNRQIQSQTSGRGGIRAFIITMPPFQYWIHGDILVIAVTDLSGGSTFRCTPLRSALLRAEELGERDSSFGALHRIEIGRSTQTAVISLVREPETGQPAC